MESHALQKQTKLQTKGPKVNLQLSNTISQTDLSPNKTNAKQGRLPPHRLTSTSVKLPALYLATTGLTQALQSQTAIHLHPWKCSRGQED